MRPVSDYLIKTTKGLRLTDAFFDASLQEKYSFVEALDTELGPDWIASTPRLYDLIVKAILQHSPDKSKKQWVVKGVRKQRPAARKADQQDAFDALFANLDRVTKAMFKDSLPDLNGWRPEAVINTSTDATFLQVDSLMTKAGPNAC